MSAFRLIEAARTSFSVPLMCKMLGVSRSGYYGWRGRAPSTRSREETPISRRRSARSTNAVAARTGLPESTPSCAPPGPAVRERG